jgi:flavin reductase (DIM6/NTAB) family NADH-FMN oxidoreductase RutF
MTTPAEVYAGPSTGAFRRFMARWPTGVAVIGMLDGDTPCGMTANSLLSVSLEPLLIAVSVRRGSRTERLLSPETGFTVSILAEGQERLAAWFARGERADSPAGEFAGIGFAAAARSGAPYIRDAIGVLECVVVSRIQAGDHAILLSEVADLRPLAADRPLVFHGGGWVTLR